MCDADDERVGDFVVTYDLPTEAEMADDGGCAAFLADARCKRLPRGIRRPRQPGEEGPWPLPDFGRS